MEAATGMPARMDAAVQANLNAMRVTPENVLQIRNALLAESLLLHDKVYQASTTLAVGKPGADEVSETAAPAFNAKIKALLDQCRGYVDALADAANQLGQVARSYGHSEQQITDSFTKFQPDNPAPTSVPTSPSAPGPAFLSFAQSLANQGPVPRPTAPPRDLRGLFPGATGTPQ